MNFTVFAFSYVPDVPTARKNFELDDLTDKEVGKVLFHQRKQRTGQSEDLTWDQQSLASISLVHHSMDYVEFESFSLSNCTEAELIHKFFNALERDGLVVSWDGNRHQIPLLHFRCMKHGISHSGYWEAIKSGQEIHFDLSQWLTPTGTHSHSPLINDIARRFHYPGMQGHDADTVWNGLLKNDYEAVSGFSDYKALNSYLIALQIFGLKGDMSYNDSVRARIKLRDHLEKVAQPSSRYTNFLNAWESENGS